MRTPKRFRALYLVPALAIIALLGWAFASPMGSSPDDDFHLVSIWCGNPANESACAPGDSSQSRTVPEALTDGAHCFIRDASIGAACQKETVDFDPKDTTVTERGNFYGAYPPLYYAFMNLLVTPDILWSVMLMRIVSVLLFVGIATALFVLLPIRRRPSLVWGWLVTVIPLGLFLITSNNPSGWAIVGVGSSWLALLGYVETTGRRRIALGALFVLSVIMAAGARSDAAIYAGLGIVLVVGFTFRRTRDYLLSAILPLVMAVVAGVFFLTSGQSNSGLSGFGGASGTMGEVLENPNDPVSQLFQNLVNIPSLWAGALGSWPIGWFDTAMPAIVTYGGVACFVAVVFGGLRAMSWRKAAIVGITGLTLWLLPAWVLFRGNDPVGQQVQPRYLLPLIVMFAGMAVLAIGERRLRLTLLQRSLIVGTLSIVQFVALYVNLRRYVQGVGNGGWNLDAGGWWWDVPFSPMFLLMVGSVAFGALSWILVAEVSSRAIVEPSPSTVDV